MRTRSEPPAAKPVARARRAGLRTASRLTVLLAALGLLGCEESDEPSGLPPPGTFTITVSGDLSRTISGVTGSFAQMEQNGQSVWVLSLNHRTVTDEVQGVDFLVAGSQPGTGQHAIVEMDDPGTPPDAGVGAVVAVARGGEESGFLGTSTDGTLTLTESAVDSVGGTFEFSASGNLFFADREPVAGSVDVTGEFSASRSAIGLTAAAAETDRVARSSLK